jgi:hypothetical protein
MTTQLKHRKRKSARERKKKTNEKTNCFFRLGIPSCKLCLPLKNHLQLQSANENGSLLYARVQLYSHKLGKKSKAASRICLVN